MNPNTQLSRNLAAPCSVEQTKRSVIEHKLLTALEDGNTVAALFSKQDLEDMIAALLEQQPRPEQMKRRKDLAEGMQQLLREAFP